MSSPASSPYSVIPDLESGPFIPGLRPEDRRPALLGSSVSVVMLAWAVRFSAVINLVASLLHHEPRVLYWLGSWVPFEISEGRRILMLLTSILLFSLASGLERRKRAAWSLTIAALAIAPLLHLGRSVLWPHAILNLSLIGFLFLKHEYFVARSDQRSVRTALIVCPVMLAALLVFGTARLLDLQNQTSGDHSFLGCLQTACELVLVQNSHTQAALTTHALDLFSTLRISGVSIALIGVFLTLRPVFMRKHASLDERARLAALIDRYGSDSLDAYALLNDKSLFFTADGRAVVPYVLSSHFAVALGNPIGPAAVQAPAIAEFTDFCRRQDWEPVFYEVTRDLVPHYEGAGFSLFKIGEEARLRADAFHLKGGEFQNLRTACNRAHKLGLRFVPFPNGDNMDGALESQLRQVSRRWLKSKKGQEMAFDMGAYSTEDLRVHGAHVALDADGKVLAFATWRPFAQGRGRALDLMRSLPEARNVMDFILVESILHFRDQGIHEISLGTAPLANTEHRPTRRTAEDKAVQFLFEHLNRIYGYKSLFEFKRKYRPEWAGRYVAYRRASSLPLVGLALVRVHAPEGVLKFLIG